MPFEISTFQLPGGARCGRVVWGGVATGEEEADMAGQAAPGGQLYGVPVLVLTQGMKRLEPETRAALSRRTEANSKQWVAIVVSSPVVRVAANFIMRTSKNPRQRLFSNEAEAIRWLDERIREEAQQEKPGTP